MDMSRDNHTHCTMTMKTMTIVGTVKKMKIRRMVARRENMKSTTAVLMKSKFCIRQKRRNVENADTLKQHEKEKVRVEDAQVCQGITF